MFCGRLLHLLLLSLCSPRENKIGSCCLRKESSEICFQGKNKDYSFLPGSISRKEIQNFEFGSCIKLPSSSSLSFAARIVARFDDHIFLNGFLSLIFLKASSYFLFSRGVGSHSCLPAVLLRSFGTSQIIPHTSHCQSWRLRVNDQIIFSLPLSLQSCHKNADATL